MLANFNGFGVLAALLHGSLLVGVSQTIGVPCFSAVMQLHQVNYILHQVASEQLVQTWCRNVQY